MPDTKSIQEYYKEVKGQFKSVKTTLKTTVKGAVQKTNENLGQVESFTRSHVVQPVQSAVSYSKATAQDTLDKASYYYQHRHQYGPHVALASGTAVAGLVALRVGGRARLPAALLTGSAVGGATYTGIYQS